MTPRPIPDRPVDFGYKQQWLAVWDRDPRAVAEALGLKDTEPSTWREGIERGYDLARHRAGEFAEVFVSPPVLGWTLAVGGVGVIPAVGMPAFVPFLCSLSARLGHVQYFGNHRVSCFAAWAKAERGRIVRAYGAVDYTTRVNIGDPTPEETELGFDFLDENATPSEVAVHEARVEADRVRMDALREEIAAMMAAAEARGERFDESILDDERFASRFDRLVPNEDSVMLLASRWSIDPMRLGASEVGPGLGLIGEIWEEQSRSPRLAGG
jgi:hypothetical protein